MTIIEKIKERFVALPKKYQKIIIAAVIGIIILAILLGTSGGKKLSGSYRDGYNEYHRYEFLRTGNDRGDYGGTLNEYYSGELRSSYSWYVIDDTVYVDGNQRFHYDGNVLYGISPEDGITVEDGNYLSGSNRDFKYQDAGGMMFIHDGKNRNAYYYAYKYIGYKEMEVAVEGTYKVEGNIVYICDEYGNVDYTFYIVGNELYGNVFLPT